MQTFLSSLGLHELLLVKILFLFGSLLKWKGVIHFKLLNFSFNILASIELFRFVFCKSKFSIYIIIIMIFESCKSDYY